MKTANPMTDTDGEVRELTAAEMKRFRPASEVFSPGLAAKLKTRGPQKAGTSFDRVAPGQLYSSVLWVGLSRTPQDAL